jgi:hypothetical protein
MRHQVLALCLLTLAANVFAANETVILLEAPRIRDIMYVRATGTKLEAKLDGQPAYRDLKPTYKAGDQITMLYEDFNPLLVKIETTETFRDDETAKAISDFLQKLIDTGSAVGVASAEAAAAANAAARNTPQQINAQLDALALRIAGDRMENNCTDYEKLHEWLLELRILMNVPVVTAARFKQWVGMTTSAQGVANTQADMTLAGKEIEANEKAIAGVVASIAKYFKPKLEPDNLDALLAANNWAGIRAAISGLEATDPKCSNIHASTFAALLDISRDAAKTEAKKSGIKDALSALNKSLKPYADANAWLNTNDYIVLKPKPDPAKIDKITVAISTRTPPDDDISVALTESKPVSGSFDLRKYSAIIGEVAAALIYTDIEYKEFGTEEKNGELTVKEVEASHFPVEGAMTLNLIPAFLGKSFVYPTFQLGVSTAKDAPGVLAGIGLRFTETRQLSLTIGRMVTWHKELQTLKPGDVVTGTAQIEADKKLERAPAAWYGGLQYSF